MPAGIVSRWKSFAMWPDGCCPGIGNYSENTHDSRPQAEAVCAALKREGFGGNGQFYPLKTWIEEIQAHQITPA